MWLRGQDKNAGGDARAPMSGIEVIDETYFLNRIVRESGTAAFFIFFSAAAGTWIVSPDFRGFPPVVRRRLS